MKQLFLFALLITTSLRVGAQVSLNVQLPGGGLVATEQLWNITLVSNAQSNLNVYVKLGVRDAVSNVEILSGKSRDFILAPGTKTIFSQDVQPILYNYTSQDFSRSFLPLGEYIACYEVMMNELKETSLTQECIQLNIDPLSPPLLNSPTDQSEIQNPYPHFTWLPPAPLIMFSRINYDLVVVEVMPGQAPTDAVQQNIPVYTRTNLSQPFEYLSSAATSLQLNKVYAWQVLARNASNYSGKTEVWTFTLKNHDQTGVRPSGDHYFILEDAGSGIHHVNTESLKIRYYSTASRYLAQIKFLNEKGRQIKTMRQEILPGNNYLDLRVNDSFDKGTIYKICLVDHEQANHYLSFKLQ